MLEIIGMTLEDAKIIEYCGADRIELVSALTEGGLTPSFGMIESVIKNVKIPVNVMIRNHAKGFIYSDDEIDIMIRDLFLEC
ncbi:Copper homeostasis protein CutC [Clostridioides difficile]|nr:Copper homeostasis protein CutC [Clostridioides difficile]